MPLEDLEKTDYLEETDNCGDISRTTCDWYRSMDGAFFRDHKVDLLSIGGINSEKIYGDHSCISHLFMRHCKMKLTR